jgi:UDP:flavonoid glycosyltransferase YjiC (YdhE family)
MTKNIKLLTSGTLGDVTPYIALGLGLRDAGYSVRIAAPVGFASLVESSGLPFAPFEGNPSDLMINQGDPLTIGSSFIHSIRATREFLTKARPLYARMLHTAADACRGSHALLYGLPALWGTHIAEGLHIPAVRAVLQPLTPTYKFPSALLPFRYSFLGIGNWFTHWIVTQATWLAWRREINHSRRADFGLPRAQWIDPSLQTFSRQPLTLNGFSEHIVPRPPDWNEKQIITGYWRSPAQQWNPPDELINFIDRFSENTIAIGLGTPGTKDFTHLIKILEEALDQSDTQAVLTFPIQWHAQIKSKRIFPIEYAPHDWLYCHVRVAVHHGGAGTTSASLHTGIPTIILPLAIDQFFWGECVHKIGVGPRPIPQRGLSVVKLAAAIQQALQDDDMRENAKRVSRALSLENGIQAAVRVIRDVV